MVLVAIGAPKSAMIPSPNHHESGWRLREVVSRRGRHVDLGARTVRLEPGETKSRRPRRAKAERR